VKSARLSVAMATYNGAEFLSAQLASIAAQSRPPDELVVRDDGSTDATRRVIEAFAEAAPFRVELAVNARNLGSTATFERAVAACRGDVIALADQDDVWRPGKLARLLDALERRPDAALVFSDADLVDAAQRPLGPTLWERVLFTPRLQRRVARGEALEVLLRYPVVTGTTVAFRASLRERALPIPPVWVHDGWLACVAAVQGGVVAVPDRLVLYRRHDRQQIGAPRALWREVVARARRERPAGRETPAQYTLLRERLTRDPPLAGADVLRRLDEKIAHLEARAALPASLVRRIPVVARELLRGRYARCSHGARSVANDLVFG